MTYSPRICLTLAKSLVTPVAVSLWTMQIALIVCEVSEAIFDSRTSSLAPWPHSLSTTSTLNFRRCCWSIQSKLNWPIRKDTIRSPGDSVFVRALSQAPVPEPNTKSLLFSWRTESLLDNKKTSNRFVLIKPPYSLLL